MVKKMSDLWREALSCAKSEKGVTTMEYALVGALISVVAIGAMTTVGANVTAVFTSIAGSLAAAI